MIDKLFWSNKNVFVSGHTGFKGSWLCLWLASMGAKVTGYALKPPTNPSMYNLCQIGKIVNSVIGDVRDLDFLSKTMVESNPDVIFHLAAQPIVRESYINPVLTYSTNLMGTVNVLEAARSCKNARAIINVTSDKCYKNEKDLCSYKENDPMGGYDPYSSSKGCSELITSAYRNSFFNRDNYSQHGVGLASARAGNVIGGGDWAKDRLVPDCFRAILNDEEIEIRNPQAVRPWQHVLEPLSGYLMLAQKLYEDGVKYGQAWNFGPEEDDAKPVEWIVREICTRWGTKASYVINKGYNPFESQFLRLDCTKSKTQLGWRPNWNLEYAITKIMEWILAYRANEDLTKLSLNQIEEYSSTWSELYYGSFQRFELQFKGTAG